MDRDRTEHSSGTPTPAIGRAIIVMGASGSGKSTIAATLAAELGARYIDADDLHAPAAIEQMRAGVPLTDEDRWPWLETIGARITQETAGGSDLVVACSALRRVYRDRLRAGSTAALRFVQLQVPREVLIERVQGRSGHFMPSVLIDSQLATLEPLDADESGFAVDGSRPEVEVLDRIERALGR
ncbi:gluconokinase [Leucobacter sp. USCH14]|uniref:gluconokinase n=1 Tax=Leucobacter sp. USCH14 TaxID=3024838 RepID=UPI0030B779EE